MIKEMINFAKSNRLSVFNKSKTVVKPSSDSIYKTRDAKSVHTRLINKISENFIFTDSGNLWNFFPFTKDIETIKNRQEFFKTLIKTDNTFLRQLKTPKVCWKPKYGIIAVTENEITLTELKKLNCPVQYLNSQYDIEGLDNYDIVQVIDCEQFSPFLEQLPQSVFINSIEDVYLERYLEILSSWKDNLNLLENNMTNNEIKVIVDSLSQLLSLTEDKKSIMLSKDKVETALETINEEVESKIKDLNIPGTSLFSMLSKGKLPEELENIIDQAINKTGLKDNLFNSTIPVTIDDQELEKAIKIQNANEHTSVAEQIKKQSKELRQIPKRLQDLELYLIIFDFVSGISKMIKSLDFPIISEELSFTDSENMFLDNAKPISFHLTMENRCSILTGANSGGKTTLLEHLIQLISMFQLGLPSKDVKMPIFTDVYYFAKNKGGTGKGAFENLLTQMDSIKPGKKTIILADEIESVTEPGVAGKIISATAEYFINKGCFLVIATHLGQEIQKNLPNNARIDGIEAKGLNEFYELIVDHNPVLGKLASSTPELILEKMANSNKTEYFKHLYEKVRTK